MRFLTFVFISCGFAVAGVLPSQAVAEAGGNDEAVRQLHRLFDEAWEFTLQESPLFATRNGDRRFNDRLAAMSLADCQRRHKTKQSHLQRLNAIDRTVLPRGDRVNYDIFRRLLENEIAEYEFGDHLIPLTSRSGFHISFPELPKQVPLESLRDYRDYIQRLRAFDRYTDDHIELLRAGIDRQMVLPAVVLEGFRRPITAHIVEDPTKSRLFEPFAELAAAVPAEHHEALREQAAAAISKSVVPGYRRLLDFMEKEYVPAARGSIAASTLPEGRPYYRYLVQKFTTLDLTPDEVHQTGLREVKRIKAEMLEVIKQSGFEGDFAAFVEFLRTDERFYADSSEALLKEVAIVLKKMDGKLPALFKTLPRTPYGIREVPSYIAPRTTTAYYMPPAGDGSQAGFYYVNTYDLKSRPLYEIEALSLHEAVPGHHLQIALQQEMAGLPQFRRFAGFTAFVEGWALYAERLGLEVGFYADPYSDFGRLTYEMWRACRLVVDTGMHYFGWTRQQAIEFMAENSALSLHNIEAEVDRYISWPGQALGYKIGELKIRELRTLAEQQLGEQFDLRQFHEVVLGSGSVPLTVLEDNVRGYINSKLSETGSP